MATKTRRPGSIAANITGVGVFIVMAFPVYWMINTAFKPRGEILNFRPHFFPEQPTLENFQAAINRANFWDVVSNTLIVVAGVVTLSLVCALLAAMAIARFRFYGRRAFLIVIIGVQMIPLNALVIPLFLLLQEAGQTDRLAGVVVSYLALTLPLTIWILRGFVVGIPKELEEAAMVDGCSRMGAFVRIVLPLIAPGVVATSIFAFIQAWNEYLLASVFLTSDENKTISVWLANFFTDRGTAWGPLMAATTLVALPVVSFFLVIHNRIAAGLVSGAVKG